MAGTNTKPNARVVISHGRQAGKSHISHLLRNWHAGMSAHYKPKIKWQRLPGHRLRAYVDEIAPRGFERGLNESDMDPVQAWSEQCNCGTRMSFNEWKFKNEKHITMFLMKWAE
jgi:hypothetical protein